MKAQDFKVNGECRYFYLYSPGAALAYIKGVITEVRERSIIVRDDDLKIDVPLPICSLSVDKTQSKNFNVAKWVQFNDAQLKAIRCV